VTFSGKFSSLQNQKEIVFQLKDDALAKRRSAKTFFPSALLIGGSTERRTNGLESRIRSSARPAMRGCNASM
jgi:hypothetical protein